MRVQSNYDAAAPRARAHEQAPPCGLSAIAAARGAAAPRLRTDLGAVKGLAARRPPPAARLEMPWIGVEMPWIGVECRGLPELIFDCCDGSQI